MSPEQPYRRIRVSDTSYAKDAGRLFTFLVGLARPLMIANRIKIRDFFEIDPRKPRSVPDGDPKRLLGIYYTNNKNLGLLLTDHLHPKYPKKLWREYEDLMCALLHELTHAYIEQHRGGHNSRNGGHDSKFYKALYSMQHQYYETYTRVHAKLSTFVPDRKTIDKIRGKRDKTDVTTAIGMTGKLKERTPVMMEDFNVEIRQWAIERKLDSEGAAAKGKKLGHYKGTGVEESYKPTDRRIGGTRSGTSNLDDFLERFFGGKLKVKGKLEVVDSKGRQRTYDLSGKTKDLPSLDSLFRSKLRGFFNGKDDGYFDDDGYLGLTSHPENESFIHHMVNDAWDANHSMSMSNCCCLTTCGESTDKAGCFIDVDDSLSNFDSHISEWESEQISRAVAAADTVRIAMMDIPDASEDDLTNWINEHNLVKSMGSGTTKNFGKKSQTDSKNFGLGSFYNEDEALSKALAESSLLCPKKTKSDKDAKQKKSGLSKIFSLGSKGKSSMPLKGEISKAAAGRSKQPISNLEFDFDELFDDESLWE